MMGFFQDTGASVGGVGRTGALFQYQRLELRDDGSAAPSSSRWRWLPAAVAVNGKASSSSPCLFHVKKLKWGSITSALIPRKVAELSAKIRRVGAATTEAADVCPAVIFMSPWGLPVLSRPLLGGHIRRRHQNGRDAL
ncbi:hypothetical protein HU200_065128 [Digitaria exilis]|uniref:Uncharacterized protein n=1 Tax=Digitaria exilis TaxID=1010633 RepID=A0A835A2G7_9POAL|nr:hypothetical protein HU200_065128 [Digitaria exilis]CAB3456885.1 unnamed protein product [Digitaria exilis]